jgi:hypothetical protein
MVLPQVEVTLLVALWALQAGSLDLVQSGFGLHNHPTQFD